MTDQLLQIVRTDIATVKSPEDKSPDAVNMNAIRYLFPGIDAERLRRA